MAQAPEQHSVACQTWIKEFRENIGRYFARIRYRPRAIKTDYKDWILKSLPKFKILQNLISKSDDNQSHSGTKR